MNTAGGSRIHPPKVITFRYVAAEVLSCGLNLEGSISLKNEGPYVVKVLLKPVSGLRSHAPILPTKLVANRWLTSEEVRRS